MKPTARVRREEEIAAAAYAILAEKGLSGLSMLAVAKRAKASNETLYRWYGDKIGLFRALIAQNAASVADQLDALMAEGAVPRLALALTGQGLLDMVLSKRAIALNRAAAADASDQLGAVLAEAGRGAVFPRIVALMARLVADGALRGPPEAAAALWVDLLLGDWQIRCVTGAMAPPDAAARAARAARAEALLFDLLGPEA